MTGLPSGNLTRYLFKADAGVSFLSGSVLLIRQTPDIRSLEIVLPKPSSMVSSTASGLVIAGTSLALLQRVQIDGSEFLLSPPQKQFSGPPELVGYGSGVLKP